VTDIRDNPFSGVQSGVAIRVGAQAFGQTGSANIHDNVTITGFQKNGITVDGPGSSAVIANITVTGAGPTNIIAQNLIQASRGAVLSVTGCTLSAAHYTPLTVVSTGVLLFQAGNGTLVDGNDISDTDVAVYNFDSGAIAVSNNTIYVSEYGIYNFSSSPTTIDSNTVRSPATPTACTWTRARRRSRTTW
jgi:parallel beta-helix repeat protein